MFQSSFGSGIPIGRLAGIELRIHWTLILWWAFDLNGLLSSGLENRVALVLWVVGVGLLFGSILLHEFGHAFAARYVGGDATEILLWPLGGLAFCRAPNTWKAQLIVAAGGPLVTLGIVAVGFAVFGLGAGFFASLEGLPRAVALQSERVLCYLNLVLLVFNLIPLYPLDGGRIFLSTVWGYFSFKQPFAAYGRAVGVTLWASRATAVAGIGLGLYWEEPFLVVICALCWWSAEQLRR